MCMTCNPAREAKSYRHRAEMPLVILSGVMSLAAVVAGITILAMSDKNLNENEEYLTYLALTILVAPVGVYVYRLYMMGMERSNAAKVGPEQFPQIWNIYNELLDVFELPHPPALYVKNGNGVVNAYAISCTTRRKYVVLHAEIAALAKQEPDIVRFVLAHELAHHKLGHTHMIRAVIGIVMSAMFLPGKAYIRAQEYSADRLAMAICPDAAETLTFLAVGPWMAADLNIEAFAQQIPEEDKSLMTRIANISSDHAVLTKRIKALHDIEKDGFKKHGQMF